MSELDLTKSQGVIVSDNADQQGQGMVFEVSKVDLEEIKVAMEKCRIAGLDPQDELRRACLTRNDPHYSFDFAPVPDNLRARFNDAPEIIGIQEDVMVCCKRTSSLTARISSSQEEKYLMVRNQLDRRPDQEESVEVIIFQTPELEKLED